MPCAAHGELSVGEGMISSESRMRGIRMSGSMSGDWKTESRRGVRHRAKAAGNSYPHPPTATAPVVDSTFFCMGTSAWFEVSSDSCNI